MHMHFNKNWKSSQTALLCSLIRNTSNFPQINILDLSHPLWIHKWLSILGLLPCLVNLCRLFSGTTSDVNVCLWAGDFKRCWQKTITESVQIKVHCPLKEGKKKNMDESSMPVLCFCSGPLLLQLPLAHRQRWGQTGLGFWLVAIWLCMLCLFVFGFGNENANNFWLYSRKYCKKALGFLLCLLLLGN